MNEELTRRLRAAAGAAWWVVLIGAVWMTVGYLVWLAYMHYRPAWVLTLWGGGDLTWSDMQTISLWFFGVIKMGLFAVVLAAIWLTLFARRLERAG